MGRRRKPQIKDLKIFETDNLRCLNSPVLGRYLVTKREIMKGEILIKEPWLVAGPSLSEKMTICVGCHSQIHSTEKCCKGCGWYICKDACSTTSPFHAPKECAFFSENKIRPVKEPEMDFGVITILRSLMLKIEAPESTWKEFISLQSHRAERSVPGIRNNDQILKNLILKTWNLAHLFTAEEIENICGILEVNGFEMGDAYTFEGIFLKSSMIAHDCIPNCSQSENIDEMALEVSAIVDIPADTTITLCYDAPLEGTIWRQRKIQSSKHFLCECKRCQDPTELGTNFSTLICIGCKTGYLVKSTVQNGVWSCRKCSQIMSDAEVDAICSEYKILHTSLDTDVVTREQFLKKCSSTFHPNHFIPFKAYGHDEGLTLEVLSPSQVARKLDLCLSVIKVLDILCPGQSVPRGNILYEIQAAQVLTVRQLVTNEKCSNRLLKTRVKIALSNLKEAIAIFQVHYPLRMLANNARDVTLVELNNWLKML